MFDSHIYFMNASEVMICVSCAVWRTPERLPLAERIGDGAQLNILLKDQAPNAWLQSASGLNLPLNTRSKKGFLREFSRHRLYSHKFFRPCSSPRKPLRNSPALPALETRKITNLPPSCRLSKRRHRGLIIIIALLQY